MRIFPIFRLTGGPSCIACAWFTPIQRITTPRPGLLCSCRRHATFWLTTHENIWIQDQFSKYEFFFKELRKNNWRAKINITKTVRKLGTNLKNFFSSFLLKIKIPSSNTSDIIFFFFLYIQQVRGYFSIKKIKAEIRQFSFFFNLKISFSCFIYHIF